MGWVDFFMGCEGGGAIDIVVSQGNQILEMRGGQSEEVNTWVGGEGWFSNAEHQEYSNDSLLLGKRSIADSGASNTRDILSFEVAFSRFSSITTHKPAPISNIGLL